MPSSFKICYPDVTTSALLWSVTDSNTVDHSIENTFYGPRHNFGILPFVTSPGTVTFDLGLGNSRTVDHLIIGGAHRLLASGIDRVVIKGSNDGSTWVNQLGTTSAFASRAFNGPDGQDVIFTPTYNDTIAGTLAAYRFFRLDVGYTSSAATVFPFSKLYTGTAFDMDVEPATYNMEVTTERDSDTWKYHRGHTLMTRAHHPRHRFTVEWEGVSDAKATEFNQKILNNPYRDYVWLYAATHQDPLYDNRLVYCKVIDEECTVDKEYKDWNVIKAVFEESL